mgnify:CR=1 FL=1
MVIHHPNPVARFAMVELIAAMMILSVLITVVTLNTAMERRRMRALYHRAVAEQVLDGYRDLLAAGAWRQYPDGRHTLDIDAPAFQALPNASAVLHIARQADHVAFSLRWEPKAPTGAGSVRKEAVIPLQSGTTEVRQ